MTVIADTGALVALTPEEIKLVEGAAK